MRNIILFELIYIIFLVRFSFIIVVASTLLVATYYSLSLSLSNTLTLVHLLARFIYEAQAVGCLYRIRIETKRLCYQVSFCFVTVVVAIVEILLQFQGCFW